jgi:hypothetical protein
MRTIDRMLKTHRLNHDVVGLFDFLEAGIKGRELAKFVFSHSLSDALSLLQRLGGDHGFSGDDMSYADIRTVYDLHAGSRGVADALAASVAQGRAAYAATRSIVLPPLIVSPDQAWSFEVPPTEPNFITQKSATGPVIEVDGTDHGDLDGTIAVMVNADPGYDWIFSRGIKGFITAYGGVNSHMAIRASELGLPAVIGAGQRLYSQWAGSRVLEVDAANRQVRVIQ